MEEKDNYKDLDNNDYKWNKNNKAFDQYSLMLSHAPYSKHIYSYVSYAKIGSPDGTNTLSDITSKVNFSLEKKLNGKNWEVNFEILNTFINDMNPEGQKIAEMGKLFATPISHLILKLTRNGEIDSVQNKGEIAYRWEDLYRNIVKDAINNDLKNKLRQAGDNDYLNPNITIKSSFLHSILFFPIFNKEYNDRKKDIVTFCDKSKLLQNEQLRYNLENDIKYLNKDVIAFHYKGEDSSKSLYKKAHKIYKGIVPEEGTFFQTLDIFYYVNIQNGLPLLIKTQCTEIVENSISYIHTSEIKITQ